jgi:Fur family ferric uptake transcriptional regulator
MLRGNFQRNTRQRQVILEELRAIHCHPTASELHEMVRRRLPRISLGTVYRTLDLLVRLGAVQRLESGRGQARFDGNPDRHHHVRCVGCGQVADMRTGPSKQARRGDQQIGGYEILGLRVEYIGICPACRDRMPPDERDRLRREWR